MAIAAVMVVLLGIGAYAFEPWRLFTSQHIDEAAPSAAPSSAAPSSTVPSSAAPRTAAPSRTASAPAPTVVRTGRLIAHEHPTSGTVQIFRLADGSRLLRITDLATSDGPDLRVWLSQAPVIDGRDGWFVFGQHPHVELGRLKGNQGNQNYSIPAGVDLDSFTSVSIWCARFRVSFGAAALRA